MSAEYRFGPREQRGVFLGVRAGQLGVGVAASLLAVALVSRWPSLPGALAALTILLGAAAGVLLPAGGRSLQEWAAVALRYAVDELLGEHRWIAAQQLRGHDLVLDAQSSCGELTDPRPTVRARRFRRDRTADRSASDPDDGGAAAARWVLDARRVDGGEAQPPYLRGVEMLAARWRQGEIGVVKDSRARTYVGVIAASGRGFALLDHGAKERLLEQWGRALAAAAREGSALTRVQWLERTVPDDSESVVDHLRAGCAVGSASPFVRSYLEVVDAAGPQTQQHEVYLALEVSAWRASPVIRQLHAGADVGGCEALSRELDSFVDHLHQADVEVRGILSPRALASVLRAAADPAAREASAARAAVDPDLAGASPRTALPRRSRAHWSRLRTEGTWQATYWVSEWPRVAVDGDW
ncbi:MAG TPA: SCO6880 family protein, partial [Candidatus Dormibacteraeota bacterium]|nr:SCO6880 family protein [Candidatus Dormibacteraeota bacterium]